MAQTPGPLTTPSLTDYAKRNVLRPQRSTEKRWYREAAISGGRWNQAYPFQLIVVERTGENTYIPKSDRVGSWTFTLPIPPESLEREMPFATDTRVTMGGIVEQHNGAPLRMISLSGTTGVLFGKSDGAEPQGFNFLDSIFAGTVKAAQGLGNSIAELANGSQVFDNNIIPQASFDDPAGMQKLTGYYQFLLLQYFLEDVADLFSSKEGRRARLAFANWKDGEVYLVTPKTFRLRRSVTNVLEYPYTLQLLAYKRIKISAGVVEKFSRYTAIQHSPDKLQKLLNTVENARRVLQGAKKTILALGGDVQRALFTPMRELCLFAKDAMSVPLAVADLADATVQNARDAIVELKSTGAAISNFPANSADRFHDVTTNTQEIDLAIGSLAAEQGDDPVRRLSRAIHPANDPFSDPAANYDFFAGVQVGDLHLPPSVSAAIAAERERVRGLTRLDFEAKRDSILKASITFANAIGLGSDTLNKIYGFDSPPTSALNTATDQDFEALSAMNSLVMELNQLVVTTDNEPNALLDSISAVAGLAERAGIAFQIPKSKFAVPFPYGSTLEMLSKRYLGDPNRWHEIAALNGLQTPYVDEIGFETPLATNGSGNTVTVRSVKHLFVGKPVWISSKAATRTKRRIRGIARLSEDLYSITVDGDPDMGRYSTMGEAILQSFLPNTVNSQQTIYIPSDQEPKTGDFRTTDIPGVDTQDELIAVGGADLLLSPRGDLVVTPDGDARWAVGLNNVVQQARLALGVRQGSLNQHPEFGLPLKVGQSVADLDPSEVIRAAEAMFANNPTFAGVSSAALKVADGVAQLGVNVIVASTGQVIPISAEVTI